MKYTQTHAPIYFVISIDFENLIDYTFECENKKIYYYSPYAFRPIFRSSSTTRLSRCNRFRYSGTDFSCLFLHLKHKSYGTLILTWHSTHTTKTITHKTQIHCQRPLPSHCFECSNSRMRLDDDCWIAYSEIFSFLLPRKHSIPFCYDESRAKQIIYSNSAFICDTHTEHRLKLQWKTTCEWGNRMCSAVSMKKIVGLVSVHTIHICILYGIAYGTQLAGIFKSDVHGRAGDGKNVVWETPLVDFLFWSEMYDCWLEQMWSCLLRQLKIEYKTSTNTRLTHCHLQSSANELIFKC